MVSPFRLEPASSFKRALLAGVAVVVILGIAYWAFELGIYEPAAIRFGQVTISEGRSRITVRTRLLSFRQRSLWQFEVSPGVWRDCAYDCEKALRRALAE